MKKRLEILKKSLENKENLLNDKIQNHFASVKEANGQPLNDKRGGRAIMNKWEKQSDSISNTLKEVEKTKNAIEKEENKIYYVEKVSELIPLEIMKLVESGELIQWNKYPYIFFVKDVEKARIIWEIKTKKVAHKFSSSIPNQEQRSKFVRIYNELNSFLNK